MKPMMKQRRAYWISGIATAFAGVASVKLLAPELTGVEAIAAQVAGYTMVAAGITTLAFATRRKGPEAYIAVEKDNPDQERNSSRLFRR